MYYCGLDLSRRSSHFCVLDQSRQVVREGVVRHTPTAIRRAFGEYEPMRFVLEATTQSYWVTDRLRELGHDPRVVDPNRTKAIGAALIKHDRLDARVLAQLGVADLLAEIRVPSHEERLRRVPITSRDVLARSRTGFINALRGMLASEGISLPNADAERLVALVDDQRDALPDELYQGIAPLLDAMVGLEICIRDATDSVVLRAKDDELLRRLQTVPGVGPITASIFVDTIQDPNRFADGRSVGAYLGLVPRLYQSGKVTRRGQITKHGNRSARWALTMSANSQHQEQQPPPAVGPRPRHARRPQEGDLRHRSQARFPPLGTLEERNLLPTATSCLKALRALDALERQPPPSPSTGVSAIPTVALSMPNPRLHRLLRKEICARAMARPRARMDG